MNGSNPLSTTRLYGGTIAIVSGAYSAYLSVSGVQMATGAWFMLALGVVVVIHGLVLLTPIAARLGGATGPLMLVYSGLMLLNQLRLSMNWTIARMGGDGMDGMGSGTRDMGLDGMGTAPEVAMMGADAGMVAIAVMMLASGLIMTVRRDMITVDG